VSARLHKLDVGGRKLVTPELARGEIDRLPEEAYKANVEPFPRVADLAEFDAVIDEVCAHTPSYDAAAIDGRAAPAIHAALRLSRREAADAGVWRWLAVIHRPDFVRHRWEFRSWTTMRDRFWRAGTRPDSNAIGRLWWIAELTVVGGSYELTDHVLATQTLANAIFVRQLSGYLPAVQAVIEMVAGTGTGVVEHLLLRLHRHLSVAPLEARTARDLRELLTAWRAEGA
jgi:hypothetical protein